MTIVQRIVLRFILAFTGFLKKVTFLEPEGLFSADGLGFPPPFNRIFKMDFFLDASNPANRLFSHLAFKNTRQGGYFSLSSSIRVNEEQLCSMLSAVGNSAEDGLAWLLL